MNFEKTSGQIARSRFVLASFLLALFALFAFTQTLKADDGTNEELSPTMLVGGGEADLQNSTFAVDKTEAQQGEVLEYTVVISNSGNTFSEVTLEDILPSTLNYVTGSLTSDVTPISSSTDNSTIVWTAFIGNDAIATVSFQAEIDASASINDVITNTVTITGTNVTTGTMPVVLQVTTQVIQPIADLTTSTLAVDKAQAERGEVLTYTVVINNSGDAFSTVTLEDVLPNTLSYITDSLTSDVTPISSGESNGTITWMAAINGGANATVSFQAEIAATAPYSDVIINTVSITGTNLATDATLVMLDATTVVISPTVEPPPSRLIVYLPMIAKPLEVPSALALTVPPNANNEFTVAWTVPTLTGISGFELEHANSPDFANSTIQILGINTQSEQNPTPSPRSLNYYRVRTVSDIGQRSGWSNELLVIGAYYDNFSDGGTGWTMRRQDIDHTDNQNYYRDGHYVLEMDSRWDYQIAAPLLPAPNGDYVIESSAKMVGVDNLHTYGFIFGSDWNGQPCPATDYTSCFNEYYRLLITWRGSDSPMKLQLKRITQHSEDDNTGQGTDLISFNDIPVNSPSEGYQLWRVEISGGSIDIYVNDTLVGQATDPNPFGGRYFGVIAAVDEYTGLEAEYDWYRVRPK